MAPRFTDHIKSLPAFVPFVGPEAMERMSGRPFRARIGANESVFGPSPKAVAAMNRAAEEVWKYADPENHDLRLALAEFLPVNADEVVVGEGIDGLLGLAVRLFVEKGVKVVMPQGAYPTFAYHVDGAAGSLVRVPYVDDREPIAELLAAAREHDAAIIYLSNPDNPMGTWWDGDAVNRMIGELPEGCMLFLDEAYGEFAPRGVLPAIDTANPMVLRFRTFSKAYGMAGARIGYAIGGRAVIAAINKIRNHYGVNNVGQAGALAALRDQEWLEQVRARVARGRERIYAIAEANGLAAIPSATNFVTLDCGGDFARAKGVLDALIADGIFVRMPFAAPGNRCIRIGVGTDAELDLFAEALPRALATTE
ncbi:MAG: pyridoxal phosphate-dependent aminotransferase [Nitratireductor sp.]|nr:pyridoxal phosphate-dependent aminotransferase [Nitratireductor sp.]